MTRNAQQKLLDRRRGLVNGWLLYPPTALMPFALTGSLVVNGPEGAETLALGVALVLLVVNWGLKAGFVVEWAAGRLRHGVWCWGVPVWRSSLSLAQLTALRAIKLPSQNFPPPPKRGWLELHGSFGVTRLRDDGCRSTAKQLSRRLNVALLPSPADGPPVVKPYRAGVLPRGVFALSRAVLSTPSGAGLAMLSVICVAASLGLRLGGYFPWTPDIVDAFTLGILGAWLLHRRGATVDRRRRQVRRWYVFRPFARKQSWSGELHYVEVEKTVDRPSDHWTVFGINLVTAAGSVRVFDGHTRHQYAYRQAYHLARYLDVPARKDCNTEGLHPPCPPIEPPPRAAPGGGPNLPPP